MRRRIRCGNWLNLFLVVSLLLITSCSYSQNFNEWTRQKETQTLYLLQQIAQLQLYMSAVEKGYTLVSDGLNFIGDVKQHDLSLHSDFFQSRRIVNPFIRKHFHYNGPCQEEFNRLVQDGYYSLTDHDRITRLQRIIQHCQP